MLNHTQSTIVPVTDTCSDSKYFRLITQVHPLYYQQHCLQSASCHFVPLDPALQTSQLLLEIVQQADTTPSISTALRNCRKDSHHVILQTTLLAMQHATGIQRNHCAHFELAHVKLSLLILCIAGAAALLTQLLAQPCSSQCTSECGIVGCSAACHSMPHT